MDREPDETRYRRCNSGNCAVSHHPKPAHYKASHTILEYLNATSDLGLTLRMDNDFGAVQLEFDFETYVDAD